MNEPLIAAVVAQFIHRKEDMQVSEPESRRRPGGEGGREKKMHERQEVLEGTFTPDLAYIVPREKGSHMLLFLLGSVRIRFHFINSSHKAVT
jgi:hypothetical protein